ncbi:hypothetical protein [Tropheryma whipplei]|uniref:hypothetical protein n=1 Tax=Tropheryma whipplei TaxID=2039 RepID=UPI001564C6C9|nr:hypothetical protein [Tropheryma whipplei]
MKVIYSTGYSVYLLIDRLERVFLFLWFLRISFDALFAIGVAGCIGGCATGCVSMVPLG